MFLKGKQRDIVVYSTLKGRIFADKLKRAFMLIYFWLC